MPWVHEDAVLLPNLLASRLELSLWGSYWRSRNQAAGVPRALGTAPTNSARGTSSGGVSSGGGGGGGGVSGVSGVSGVAIATVDDAAEIEDGVAREKREDPGRKGL